jgi:MFS family permease
MSVYDPETPARDGAACRRFLRYYYLTSTCYDFVFAYAVYTVFFSLRGLTVFQISLLLSWWALTSIVLELPTGALADTWSRRKMLALAPLIKSLCFLTWFLAGGSVYLFALGFLLWSAGGSLVSGTSEALLYDTLVHYGKRADYEKALGRRQFYFYIGLAVSGTTGGLIASYRIDLAILLSVIPLIVSSVFALLIEETPKAKTTREVRYLQHLRLALREMRSNTALRYLLIYLLGISVLWDLEEFDQLYYRLAGLPIFAFGIVSFVGSSLSALGASVAHRMKHNGLVMYALPLVSALLLVLVSGFPSIPAIGLLLLAYFAIVPVGVLVESRIQHSILGISRATVTSATSLLTGAFGVGVPIAFGLISKLWHLPAIYLASAIQLLALSLWAFGMRNRMKVPASSDPAETESEESVPVT